MKNKKNIGLYYVIGILLIIGFSVIISNITAPDVVKFNDITYSEYEEIIGSTDLEFVYVGRTDCSYCQKITPLLGQLQSEENVVFNYLNTDTMGELDFEDIKSTAKVFEGEWGTPTILAIKDGKVLNTISGYKEKEELRTFVQVSKEGKSIEAESSEENSDEEK